MTKIAELYAALAAARAVEPVDPHDDAEGDRILDRESAILAEMTTSPATCNADITCKLRAADGERENSFERAALLESSFGDARRLARPLAPPYRHRPFIIPVALQAEGSSRSRAEAPRYRVARREPEADLSRADAVDRLLETCRRHG